jgi:imidazolonepropionase-like amidohydrolase
MGDERAQLRGTEGPLLRGVHFAIQTDAVGFTVAFLPICAGLAVRDGLPYEEGLKVITIDPAEIIGVANRVRSIEKGKDADIHIISGDPLELKTRVEKVFINGELTWSR